MSMLRKFTFGLIGSFTSVIATNERSQTEVRARSEVRGKEVSGVFELVQPTYTGNTQITGEVKGLYADHRHEVQIIEGPAGTNDNVFNPFAKKDGSPWNAERKVGNIGSLLTDSQGVGKYEISDPFVKLSGPFSVVNKSIAIYENTFNYVEGKVRSEKVFKGRGKVLASGLITSN